MILPSHRRVVCTGRLVQVDKRPFFDTFQILQLLDYSDREQIYRENTLYVDQYVPLIFL